MLIMENQTADGPGELIQHFGGHVQIQVDGTFDGATVTLQVSQDNLPFNSLDEALANFTTGDVVIFKMIKGARYRLDMAGAGGSTSVSASAIT